MKRVALFLFVSTCTLTLFGQKTLYTEEALNRYFMNNLDSLDPIEGVWDVTSTQEYYHYDTLYDVVKFPHATTVAIVKDDTTFSSHDLSGDFQDVEFTPTDVRGVYLYRNFFEEINQYSKAQAIIGKSGIMEYTYDFPDEYIRIKLGGDYEKGTRVVNVLKWKKTFPVN